MTLVYKERESLMCDTSEVKICVRRNYPMDHWWCTLYHMKAGGVPKEFLLFAVNVLGRVL